MRAISVSGVPIAARAFSVRPDANLRTAAELLLANKLREIQVVDTSGQVVGLLDEAEIARCLPQGRRPVRRDQAGPTGG